MPAAVKPNTALRRMVEQEIDTLPLRKSEQLAAGLVLLVILASDAEMEIETLSLHKPKRWIAGMMSLGILDRDDGVKIETLPLPSATTKANDPVAKAAAVAPAYVPAASTATTPATPATVATADAAPASYWHRRWG